MFSFFANAFADRRAPRRPGGERRAAWKRCRHPESLESRRMLAAEQIAPLADQTLSVGDAASKLELSSFFDETSITGTTVRLEMNAPGAALHIELFDAPGEGRLRTTPLTVENFLAYANAGLYDGTIVHRLVPGFVAQTGGFTPPPTSAIEGGVPTAIPTGPPLVNEPGNENVRGTLAMAKIGGEPDSATSQWFVNLDDNRSNLDFQNEGFTAFARVLGNGMAVIDSVASLERYEGDIYYGIGALIELPLRQEPELVDLGDPPTLVSNIRPLDFVTFTSVRPVDELVYTVSSSDQALVAATLEGSSLSLTPSGSSAGTATITIRATSVADPTSVVEESFDVTVSGVNQANSLLSFTSGGKWMLSQNTGSGMASSEFASWSTAIDWVDTLTGDFNGDGLVDVLGRNAANGAWYASLNQGDGTGSTRFMATWSAGANWQNLQVGDFNGDGIDDIAGRASSGAWYAGLGRADGSGLTTKYMTAWSRLVSWGDIRVGDFNGDGTDDIAGRLESNGQWWAAITAADGSAVNHNMGTWSTALSWNDVAVGDFNGDGIDDIVGRTSNSGSWYAALGSSGTPGFANRFLGAWNPTITWHEVTVADVDGDGRSDIIGRLGLPGNPADGQWWVGRMQSGRPADQPGFTNQLWGRWSQIDWQQTSFGDFDGDGRLDVIGHLPLDHPSHPGQWWIGRNTGSSFTSAAFGDYGRNAAGESIGPLGTVLKSFTIPGP
jgi:cyclophilin family peptidyl-prolyl cis-trans isomerase